MDNCINPKDLREPTQSVSNMNRTYKDSVFRKLFNNKENALALYNALTGQNLPPDVEIKFTTLEDVIYMTRKNDISFLLENVFIILFEHQSTINENMPIRDLIYYATIIQRMYNNKKFYEPSKVVVPRPEFIMLYNGTQEMPDYSELKLSDNFAGDGENNLQLTVKVYNINEGRNPEIMRRCEVLAQYSRFVSAVRAAGKNGELTDADLKRLFQECIDQGILPDFLREFGREAVNMLFEELTEEEALDIYRKGGFAQGMKQGLEEGREKGLAEGRAEGLAEGLVEGRAEGSERVNKLIKLLCDAGRMDELVESTKDKELQKKLFEEFGL